MIKFPYNTYLCLWFLVQFFLINDAKCPEKCQCKNNSDTTWNLRVKCGGSVDDYMSNWQSLDFEEDAVYVFTLYVCSQQLAINMNRSKKKTILTLLNFF